MKSQFLFASLSIFAPCAQSSNDEYVFGRQVHKSSSPELQVLMRELENQYDGMSLSLSYSYMEANKEPTEAEYTTAEPQMAAATTEEVLITAATMPPSQLMTNLPQSISTSSPEPTSPEVHATRSPSAPIPQIGSSSVTTDRTCNFSGMPFADIRIPFDVETDEKSSTYFSDLTSSIVSSVQENLGHCVVARRLSLQQGSSSLKRLRRRNLQTDKVSGIEIVGVSESPFETCTPKTASLECHVVDTDIRVFFESEISPEEKDGQRDAFLTSLRLLVDEKKLLASDTPAGDVVAVSIREDFEPSLDTRKPDKLSRSVDTSTTKAEDEKFTLRVDSLSVMALLGATVIVGIVVRTVRRVTRREGGAVYTSAEQRL